MGYGVVRLLIDRLPFVAHKGCLEIMESIVNCCPLSFATSSHMLLLFLNVRGRKLSWQLWQIGPHELIEYLTSSGLCNKQYHQDHFDLDEATKLTCQNP